MIWRCSRFEFDTKMPVVMGILNVTPDSFSDGGTHADHDEAVAHALCMVEEGAQIVDVGGESTRPGAEPVSVEEEKARTIDVVRALAERFERGVRGIDGVRVLGGGGDSSLHDAIRSGADAFVTGECKHHVLLQAADAGITFIDAGHFFTENVVVPALTDKLKKQFPEVEFKASQLISDPSQWM